ncbi:hypothetical protein Y045_1256 [Burkholderia pseudomallei MSHR2451]|nr:hypothetical protein Y045_1256 [Burkholderia pseudomallei MSHR2451]
MPAKALARIRRIALAEPDMRSRQRLMQPDACGIRMAATSTAPDARRVRHIGCAANSSHERQGGRAFATRLKFDDQSVAADASTGCLSNAAIANAATWIRANRASPNRRSSNARLPDRAGHARQIVAVRGSSNFGARTGSPARTRARPARPRSTQKRSRSANRRDRARTACRAARTMTKRGQTHTPRRRMKTNERRPSTPLRPNRLRPSAPASRRSRACRAAAPVPRETRAAAAVRHRCDAMPRACAFVFESGPVN